MLILESEAKTGNNSSVRTYLDNRVSLEIYPKTLPSNGRSIGQIVLRTFDPQKRSFDGRYPVSLSITNATIISKSDNPASTQNTIRHRNMIPFMTVNNELNVNFIPNKNIEESLLKITTPWGDILEKIRFSTGFRYSISEMIETIVYAFIIAIVLRAFFFSAFFIPSQSMETTLGIGDRIVANKLVYSLRNPKRQEIVIFKTFAPKQRMADFHLESSPHFDPTRSLREPEYYNGDDGAMKLISSIVEPDFRGEIEILDNGLYMNNLCLGFPDSSEETGKLYIHNRFFADGEISSGSIILPDQYLGSFFIKGNHLYLGDNNIDLGVVDVFHPMGHPGLVQYPRRAPRNPVIDSLKSFFFKIIGRRPQLIVGENQVIGDLTGRDGKWKVLGQPIDLQLSNRPTRFSLPYQRSIGRVELGKLYIENNEFVLKDGDRILKHFGEPILRNDIVRINNRVLGYVRKDNDGFTINGLPLTELWETRDFIKRCIALPGDEIMIRDSQVYINGDPLDESYLESDLRYSDFGPEIIPQDQYFMMGDNRSNSKDSRFIGPILRENIVGKAMFVFWPMDRAKVVH